VYVAVPTAAIAVSPGATTEMSATFATSGEAVSTIRVSRHGQRISNTL
jgi:hypothetical protein